MPFLTRFRFPAPNVDHGAIFIGLALGMIAILAQPPIAGTVVAPHLTNLWQPLIFEPAPQMPGASASFLARGPDVSFALTSSAIVLSLPPVSRTGRTTVGPVARIQFAGASSGAVLAGENVFPGTINEFIGSDPARWRTNLPTFASVRDSGVYPGIDLLCYGRQRSLEFDFDLAPHANPRQIAMRFSEAGRLWLDRSGDLHIPVGSASVLLRKPALYQEGNGRRQPVRGGFRLIDRHTVGFTVGPWDYARPLVIDPVLAYSTYLGSATNGSANAVAVDASGNAYVTGSSQANFPITSGAFQANFTSTESGGTVAFVTKFDPNGNVIYSTYLGGSVQDGGNAIAIDSSGNAYIAGSTASPDFPVTSGAFQSTDNVPEQPSFRQFTTFVTKLNPSGSALVYSTYLGGSKSDNTDPQTEGQEQATGIALDSSGNAYVTGFTYSTDFPTTSGAFQTANPAISTESPSFFVTKLNAAGAALDYSTYLGGSNFGTPPAVAVDSSGDAFVAGGAASADYPTTSGAFNTTYASTWGMAVITKLNPTGTGLVYSTFLGGNLQDFARAIAIDSSGSAYVTGQTISNNFPVTTGAIHYTPGDVFITKLNPSGSALTFSANMGLGNALEGDYGNAIAVDASGNVYVAGQASANGDFPVTPGAFQTQVYSNANGVFGSFFAKLNSTGTAIDYLTYLSGSGTNGNNVYDCDCINGMALDSSENAVVVGQTFSADFPTTPDAFEPGSFNFLVNYEATNDWPFVTRFNAAQMTTLPIPNMAVTENANPQYRETPLVITTSVTPATGSGVATGSVEFSTDYGILCNSLLDSTGSAACSTTDLTLGPNPVRIAYYGDAHNAPNTQIVTQTIDGIPTTTTLSANQTTVVYGNLVAFTANVTADMGSGIPTGAFSMPCLTATGYIAVGPAGSATCTSNPNVLPGTYTLVAEYDGDSNYALSTSNSVSLTIQPLGVAPAPTISPAGGAFSQQINVTLTDSAAGSTIYYTTDGSTPSATNGNPYTVPITVNSNEMVQAIDTVPGYTPSPVASATYTFAPNFTLALSPATLSLTGSQSVSSAITIGSQFGFNALVSFSCSGLPAGTTCEFAPPSINGNPQQSVTVTMTISGSGSATLVPGTGNLWPVTTFAAIFGCFGFRKHRKLSRLLLVAAISLGFFAIGACGGGGGSGEGGGGGGGNQTPITSTLTVTGTSGAIQNTAIVTVTYTP